MRRSHVAIPEHGRSKFSAIMTTYQLWPHFYTLSANREHGREHNILVQWSCNRAFTEEYLVLVDEMNQLSSFSFTFLLQRSHQACLGRDSSPVLRNPSAEMGMLIQMCIHTSLIHLPPHAGTDSQTYSVITGTDDIDVVRTFPLTGSPLCTDLQVVNRQRCELVFACPVT